MKNTKKIISLVLAICMLASLAISASAANTVDASGGTGTSSVTLSSTADGSLDGDPSATKMSVVVPTVLPIAVGTDGSVATASDAKIINNSYGAVKVNSVSIEAAQGWSLAAFGSKDTLAHEKVNSNKFGFQLAIGGDPAATKMSVTVPTVLPIAVGTDGTVSTATDAKIVNNSFGAVKVNSVSIEAAQGWSLAAFGDKATLAHEKVNANKFGFQISLGNGEKKLTDSKNASKQTLLTDAIEGCFMSGVGDTSANSIGIAYDAIVTPVSEAVTNTAIASVLFIIAWDAVQ